MIRTAVSNSPDISKLLFLILVLLFAAISAPAHGQQEYNVHTFGAVGDGSHDDTSAIQSALDAASKTGGTVYVPATSLYYKITDRLYLPSGVTLKGDGENSRIMRVNQAGFLRGKDKPKLGALVIGSYAEAGGEPKAAMSEPHFAVQDISAGSSKVVFSNPQDASNFHPDDLVVIWDPHLRGKREIPMHMMMDQIQSVDSGSLTLTHPIEDDYTNNAGDPVEVGQVGHLPGEDQSGRFGLVENATVEDLTFEQDNLERGYLILGNFWQCTIQNLWLRGASLMGISGAYSTISDIQGEYGVCPLEIGCFTNNFNVIQFVAKRIGTPPMPTVAFGISAHECGEDITFDRCEITDYTFPGSAGFAAFDAELPRVHFLGCVVHGSQGAGFYFGKLATGGSVKGCRVEQSRGRPCAVHAEGVTVDSSVPVSGNMGGDGN